MTKQSKCVARPRDKDDYVFDIFSIYNDFKRRFQNLRSVKNCFYL